ncbi:MAG: LicD family protein [Lachnospiraceae bacterium]|nr:LicD family protein [Lachnospiraceae bacterium]
MNNLAFRWGIFQNLDWVNTQELKESIHPCEKVVIGLFTDEFALRYNDGPGILPYHIRERFLNSLKFVERVIPVDAGNFSVEGVCRALTELNAEIPSSFIAGSEYGLLFEQDKEAAEKYNINFRFPGNMSLNFDVLKRIISGNTYKDYKIVLFGTGKWFDRYMDSIGAEFKPSYAVDNDSQKWGIEKSGIVIKNPEELLKEDKKHLLVIICVKDSDHIVAKLNDMGGFEYRKLLYYDGGGLADIEEFRVRLRDEKNYLNEIDGMLLELLLEFDRVCTKYNLPYFLSCGSAIGAVRHHGFIPWDDDVDVAMYQQDFDVLKANAHEIWPDGGDYKLVCPGDLGNGAFLDFLNRLMCVREHVDTNIFEKVKGKADDSIQRTANLDIYILNNASPITKKQQRNVLKLKAVYGLGMGHRAYINYDIYKKYDLFTRVAVRVTSAIGKLLPLSFIIWLHERYARRFDGSETGLCYESNGYAMTFSFDKDIFGRGKRIEVCGHDLMIAIDEDRYLNEHGYVNYMEYPPYNCRKPSHALKSPDLV